MARLTLGTPRPYKLQKSVHCDILDITPAVCYIINNEFASNGIKIPIGGMFGTISKGNPSILCKGANVRIDYHIKAFVNDWS